MSKVDILDYNAGDENQLQDPTDPYESVEKAFMDKIGKLITFAEEAMQAGTHNINTDEFYDKRGDFLDLAEDPQVRDWLHHMRLHNRVPFRRFTVADDPQSEAEDAESV